jgi:His-Xaa-Ser system protein HxsD
MKSTKEEATLVPGNILEILLNVNCYTREAITATAYNFSPEYIVTLKSKDKQNWVVHITTSKDKPEADLISVGKKFLHELIDFQVRDDIERRTGKIREIIVEHAFASFKGKETNETK